MLIQRRDAAAPRFSRAAARLPKALDPDNRRTGTHLKLLGGLAPRSSAFHFPQSRDHACPQNRPSASPVSQKRINADRFSYSWRDENPPDSIGAERALVLSRGVYESADEQMVRHQTRRLSLPESCALLT